MAGEAKLQILIKAKDEASKEFDKVGRATQDLDKKMRRMGVGMVAAGAAISGALLLAVKSAAQEEKGMIRLRVAAQNVGIAYDDVEESLEAWMSTQQQKTAVADTEQRDSLASLLRITKNVTKAQDLMSLAMDVGIGMGRDLASATGLLMYALSGNWGMLERYIPAIKEAKNQEEKWMMLRTLFKGQAEEFGKSMAGQYQLLKHNIGDIKEAVGFILMPAVQKLVMVLNAWVLMMQKVPKPLKEIGVYVGVLAGGVALLGGALLILYSLHLARMVKAVWASVAAYKAWIVMHIGLKAAIGGLILGVVMAAGAIAAVSWAMREANKTMDTSIELTDEMVETERDRLKMLKESLVQMEKDRKTLQLLAQDWSQLDEQIKAVQASIANSEDQLADWKDEVIAVTGETDNMVASVRALTDAQKDELVAALERRTGLDSLSDAMKDAIGMERIFAATAEDTTATLNKQAKATTYKQTASQELVADVIKLAFVEARLKGDLDDATRAILEQRKASLETRVAKLDLAEGANTAARAELGLAAATASATEESSRRVQITAGVVPGAQLRQRLSVLTPEERQVEMYRHRTEFGEIPWREILPTETFRSPAWYQAAASGRFKSFDEIAQWFARQLYGFEYGGMVPGPVGRPVPAVVHGGEMIIPPGGLTVVLQLDGREIARHTIKHVGRLAKAQAL